MHTAAVKFTSAIFILYICQIYIPTYRSSKSQVYLRSQVPKYLDSKSQEIFNGMWKLGNRHGHKVLKFITELGLVLLGYRIVKYRTYNIRFLKSFLALIFFSLVLYFDHYVCLAVNHVENTRNSITFM